MADTTAAVPRPKPKPDDMAAIAQNRAANAALSQASSMAGGGANLPANAPTSMAGGTPSAGCGAGSPTGQDPAAGDPNTMGPTTNAPGSLSGDTAGINPAVQNMVRNSVPSGCRAQVTPQGGYDARPDRPGSAHPRGLAADTQLFCGGQLQRAGSPQLNQYIQNLNNNGARGLAFYTRPNQQFVHADLMGPNKRRWSTDGASQAYTDAAAGGQDPGPGAANAAAAQGGGGDPCAGGGSGGCQPVQSSAAQNASSLANNQGFDVSSIASMAAGLMAGGSPMSMAMGLAQQAIGGALGGGIIGQAVALGVQGLTDPAGAISSIAQQVVGNMGGGILPSIVGNIAPSILSGSGMQQGQMASMITNTSNQIFAKQSPPKLDRFISIFNAAHSAQDFSSSLQETIGNTLNNVFGNAEELFADLSRNNWANNPKYISDDDNPYLQLRGPKIGEVANAVDNKISRQQFIGDPEEVLKNLVNNKSFNVFSSMFYNWDAYATRGFGTITNNVIDFGTDLKGLGRLADLNDILRIGTPGQIAQQIILHGAGGYAGILGFLVDSSLTFSDLSSKVNDDLVYDYLASVNDLDVIEYVKAVLEMDEDINLTTLGDLLDTSIILPRSYEYNYFENLNHIAVFLSMCINAAGRITTLGELGALVESFEVPFDSSYLEGEPAIYDYDELARFAQQYAPTGFFTSDGSLSIADFIGTAAGYIHDRTAPRIAEIQSEFYNDTEYFDDYVELLDHLTQAANGAFYVPAVPNVSTAYVNVPSRVGYTFGSYSTLDAAIIAIANAIEEELTLARDSIMADEDYAFLLMELDSLHTESSLQLAREYKLRKAYGLNLGSPKGHDQFISDGVTRVLPLSGDINAEDEINIFVNGAWQMPGSYTVNETANTITLNTAPPAKQIIAVNYKTTAFNGIANKMQVWDFAANLENLALDTGYGRGADFLRRVTTNDKHGQRITATLMNARNKARTDAAGLAFPDFETVNGTAPSYVNYIDWSGIWTADPDRAAEVYLQNSKDVNSTFEYLIQELADNKSIMQPDVDAIGDNIVRQMLFFSNGNLAISDLMVSYYNDNISGEINITDRGDLFIGYDENVPSEGYILGPYKEIVSELCNIENMQNTIFSEKLSEDTKMYLNDIEIDLKLVITIIQRILSVSVSRYFGLDEGQFREVFGIQSVSRSVIRNISNNI